MTGRAIAAGLRATWLAALRADLSRAVRNMMTGVGMIESWMEKQQIGTSCFDDDAEARSKSTRAKLLAHDHVVISNGVAAKRMHKRTRGIMFLYQRYWKQTQSGVDTT